MLFFFFCYIKHFLLKAFLLDGPKCIFPFNKGSESYTALVYQLCKHHVTFFYIHPICMLSSKYNCEWEDLSFSSLFYCSCGYGVWTLTWEIDFTCLDSSLGMDCIFSPSSYSVVKEYQSSHLTRRLKLHAERNYHMDLLDGIRKLL